MSSFPIPNQIPQGEILKALISLLFFFRNFKEFSATFIGIYYYQSITLPTTKHSQFFIPQFKFITNCFGQNFRFKLMLRKYFTKIKYLGIR